MGLNVSFSRPWGVGAMSGRAALVGLRKPSVVAGSARQRAYRARKHEGRITLPVEVDEVALTAC
jgi:hypothetical protein